MKRPLLLLSLLFLFGSHYSVSVSYVSFNEGYVHLPSGAISLQQLLDYHLVPYYRNESPVTNFEPVATSIHVKRTESEDYKHVFRSHPSYDYDVLKTFLDSFSKTLVKGDSLLIHSYFTADESGRFSYYQSTSYFELETNAMTEFSRNADEFLKVYPIPAVSQLTLKVQLGEWRPAQYQIVNAQGICLINSEIEDILSLQQLDISALSAGDYLLYVIIDGDPYIRKFVKITGTN